MGPAVTAVLTGLLFGAAPVAAGAREQAESSVGTLASRKGQDAVQPAVLRRMIALDLTAVTLDEALQAIANQGNVRLIYGDGMIGHPPNAPYDSIIAAAPAISAIGTGTSVVSASAIAATNTPIAHHSLCGRCSPFG